MFSSNSLSVSVGGDAVPSPDACRDVVYSLDGSKVDTRHTRLSSDGAEAVLRAVTGLSPMQYFAFRDRFGRIVRRLVHGVPESSACVVPPVPVGVAAFAEIVELTRRGFTSCQIAQVLGINQHTASNILAYLGIPAAPSPKPKHLVPTAWRRRTCAEFIRYPLTARSIDVAVELDRSGLRREVLKAFVGCEVEA
jgi:hypothetical protein